MRLLKNKLSLLKNMRYLDIQLQDSSVISLELLENGKRLRQQIENHCRMAANDDFIEIQTSESKDLSDINPRLRFVYTNEFRKNMQILRENSTKNAIRTIASANVDPESSLIHLNNKNGENSKLLITDNFFHRALGLAKLYNIQRERKIWWMRYSADPSHYYLEPFDVENTKTASTPHITNAQSNTIKSRLAIGDIDVEKITMVPLNEASLLKEQDFEIFDERTKKNQLPTVIRSVINLDIATCALILDAAGNNKRESTLFLNRKLTPFQCLVTYNDEDGCDQEKNLNLKDLKNHISNEIRRAGLRLFSEDEHIGNTIHPQIKLQTADKLGIPYVILLNSNSLKSGLLELRNRDTTLNETIHISDIPQYLLYIFHAN